MEVNRNIDKFLKSLPGKSKSYSVSAVLALIFIPVAQVLGGYDPVLKLLLALMVFDYVTGLTVAFRNKTLSSTVGLEGISKKVLVLGMVALSVVAGAAVGNMVVRTIVVGFYIANEAISLFDNSAKLGLPYPDKLKEILLSFKEKNDGKEEK